MDFNESVLAVCKKIPKGKISTYKLIAKKINSPKAYRAVGNALNKNKFLIKIPCHRVVSSSGFVGGYAKGTKEKIKLLEKEGVFVLSNGKINLEKYLYKF